MPADRRVWVFDLDNTLYSASEAVFPEIDRRMTEFICRYLSLDAGQANALRAKYYHEHGTTLKGLMLNHGMDPADFLKVAHDVDLSTLPPAHRLRDAIAALPGKKYVFTNGPRHHAHRITSHLGIEKLFDGFTGIDDLNFEPKPMQESYDIFCAAHGVKPGEAAFFEDMSRNLLPAHEMGFATVLVQTPEFETQPVDLPMRGDASGDHVHYVTEDLTAFLEDVARKI